MVCQSTVSANKEPFRFDVFQGSIAQALLWLEVESQKDFHAKPKYFVFQGYSYGCATPL